MTEPTATRSLPSDRVDAESRGDQFIRTAREILVETGRTDFRVQELVERSKTSLRTFYQHFKSKDELLLALTEDVMVYSAREWRGEVDQLDAEAALRLVLSRLYTRSESTKQLSLNRALTSYHSHLAETHPEEYARVVGPLRDLVVDVLHRGVDAGTVRTDMNIETLAVLVMQTAMVSARLHALGVEMTGADEPVVALWQFCVGGIAGTAATSS
jgi:AcrR family transcriptional regulator